MDNTIKKALRRLKLELIRTFGHDTELLLFGSVARGDYGEFSDVDVLVLIPGDVDMSLEERVFDLAFEVGLQYDLVFGVIVYSREFWKTPRARVMPLYENIYREGVRI